MIEVGLLTVGGVAGRFLDQIIEIGWLQGKSGLRRAVGRTLGGRIRIRMGIVFLGLGLFEQFRSLIWLR